MSSDYEGGGQGSLAFLMLAAVLARYGELQDKLHIKAVFAELSSEAIDQLTRLLDTQKVILTMDN